MVQKFTTDLYSGGSGSLNSANNTIADYKEPVKNRVYLVVSNNVAGYIMPDNGSGVLHNALKSGATGSAIGSVVGTFVPVIGNVVGAGVGAVVGGVEGVFRSIFGKHHHTKIMDVLQKLYKEALLKAYPNAKIEVTKSLGVTEKTTKIKEHNATAFINQLNNAFANALYKNPKITGKFSEHATAFINSLKIVSHSELTGNETVIFSYVPENAVDVAGSANVISANPKRPISPYALGIATLLLTFLSLKK